MNGWIGEEEEASSVCPINSGPQWSMNQSRGGHGGFIERRWDERRPLKKKISVALNLLAGQLVNRNRSNQSGLIWLRNVGCSSWRLIYSNFSLMYSNKICYTLGRATIPLILVLWRAFWKRRCFLRVSFSWPQEQAALGKFSRHSHRSPAWSRKAGSCPCSRQKPSYL